MPLHFLSLLLNHLICLVGFLFLIYATWHWNSWHNHLSTWYALLSFWCCQFRRSLWGNVLSDYHNGGFLQSRVWNSSVWYMAWGPPREREFLHQKYACSSRAIVRIPQECRGGLIHRVSTTKNLKPVDTISNWYPIFSNEPVCE